MDGKKINQTRLKLVSGMKVTHDPKSKRTLYCHFGPKMLKGGIIRTHQKRAGAGETRQQLRSEGPKLVERCFEKRITQRLGQGRAKTDSLLALSQR